MTTNPTPTPTPTGRSGEPPLFAAEPPTRRRGGDPGDDWPRLTVADVATHYRLAPATVRAHLTAGRLGGVRISGQWRLSWVQVWAGEAGLPSGASPSVLRREALRRPLMRTRDLAASCAVSVRTVERWLADGLPRRPVCGAVRIAPADAEDWLASRLGVRVAVGSA